ncbi:hypothetical protein HA466_0018170 [Hirschfeldia incana]|nr:hypothetical protein HA466_0014010 [Hirschfeldia incana]KAJ0265549.1 hypothetical protein HA466_0018170 [Hirschfeldia incana]
MVVFRSLSYSRTATVAFVLSESSLSTSADEDSSLVWKEMRYFRCDKWDSDLMKWPTRVSGFCILHKHWSIAATKAVPCTLCLTSDPCMENTT